MGAVQNDVVTIAVRAEFRGTEDVINVFDLKKTDAVAADDASILSDLEDWVNLVFSLIAAAQTIQTLYRELTAYNRTTSQVIGATTIVTPSAGSIVGDDLPPGNASLLAFPTVSGRTVGRKYLGGLAVSTLDADGAFTAASVAAFVTIANTIRAPYAGTTSAWQYGIVRRLDGQFFAPTGSVVGDVVSYQRRRRTGRGS